MDPDQPERDHLGTSDERIESASDPMARVRPPAPAGLRLARARMFGALFGERSEAPLAAPLD